MTGWAASSGRLLLQVVAGQVLRTLIGILAAAARQQLNWARSQTVIARCILLSPVWEHHKLLLEPNVAGTAAGITAGPANA